MARIRTVKPEYFRHELLQTLEAHHVGFYPMLVYEGLWCLADKAGRFEWRPKQLKLDILPFLDYEIEQTLIILADAGLIKAYESDGRLYGLIPSFETHQRFSGSEAKAPAKHPIPCDFLDVEALWKHLGSTLEAPRKHLGKLQKSGRNVQKSQSESRKHSGSTQERWKGMEYGLRKGLPEFSNSAAAAPSPSAPEDEQNVRSINTDIWPATWAYDTAQLFLTYDVVLTTATVGQHAKTVKNTLPWEEWLRIVGRMAQSDDRGYGLPALLRRLKDFRDEAQPNPNRPLTLEEAIAL